ARRSTSMPERRHLAARAERLANHKGSSYSSGTP
ncbi:MAG: hypothetical protein JWP76_3930, partial [Dactylosporangium sp.]|nr:hypothetical protein [Dactylosporangium sp.]